MGIEILLIATNNEFVQKVSAVAVGETITSLSSFQEALELIIDYQAFDFLIIQRNKESNMILKYLSSINSKMPIVIISEDKLIPNLYKNLNILGTMDSFEIQRVLPNYLFSNFAKKEVENQIDQSLGINIEVKSSEQEKYLSKDEKYGKKTYKNDNEKFVVEELNKENETNGITNIEANKNKNPDKNLLENSPLQQQEQQSKDSNETKASNTTSKASPIPRESYQKIDIRLVKRLEVIDFDFFIKLSEEKYVKVFKSEAGLDYQSIENYIQKKKIEYLYLRVVDAKRLLKCLQKYSEKMLTAEPPPSAQEARVAVQANHEAIINMSRILGFTKEIQEVAKNNVKLSLKTIGREPKLYKIMETLTVQDRSDLRMKSVVLAHISCAIAAKLSWLSEYTFQILTVASMFHDIILEQAQIPLSLSIGKDDFIENMSPEEKKFYMQHPVNAAKIVQGFTELPPGIDTLIIQHHEQPDGSGFPNGIRWTEFTPLSSLFYISNQIVSYLFRNPESQDISEFVAQHKDIYKNGHFKIVLQSLNGLSKDEFKIAS